MTAENEKMKQQRTYSVFHIKLHQRKRCHLTLKYDRSILKKVLCRKIIPIFLSSDMIELSCEFCSPYQFKVFLDFGDSKCSPKSLFLDMHSGTLHQCY